MGGDKVIRKYEVSHKLDEIQRRGASSEGRSTGGWDKVRRKSDVIKWLAEI